VSSRSSSVDDFAGREGRQHQLNSIHDGLSRLPELSAEDVAHQYPPTQPLTIVPLAIAIATAMDSASAAILLAANIGADRELPISG
jgi:hypothetical protein